VFERAIELDAGYGPAFAGLATVHAIMYEWFGAREEDLVRAERASQKALQLAPGLVDAHVSRGFTLSLGGLYNSPVTIHHSPSSAILKEAIVCRTETSLHPGPKEPHAVVAT